MCQNILATGGNDKTNNKAKDAAECAGVMISLSDALELGDTTKEAVGIYMLSLFREAVLPLPTHLPWDQPQAHYSFY